MGFEEGVFDVKQASKLDNPDRVKELRPQQLLAEVAGITRGMVCVDFGSGTGTFALPMAKMVGSKDKVYAVDRSVEMFERVRLKNPPANLVLLQREVEKTGLDSGIADVCLLAFILHELESRDSIISEAFRLLKSGGRLVVVEWKPELDSKGPPKSVRIKREQMKSLLKQVGLDWIELKDWSENHYVAVGKK